MGRWRWLLGIVCVTLGLTLVLGVFGRTPDVPEVMALAGFVWAAWTVRQLFRR